MKDIENYRRLAAEARADADKADLANVRERCLRAETAWLVMAERAERSERLREAHAVISVADHRPGAEELVETHLAVEDVAADQSKAALKVERRMDLPCDNR